jgi:hypothetical protein
MRLGDGGIERKPCARLITKLKRVQVEHEASEGGVVEDLGLGIVTANVVPGPPGSELGTCCTEGDD